MKKIQTMDVFLNASFSQNHTFQTNLDGKYFIKTLVADCHNGSRMILTRNNDDFDNNNLMKAYDNLKMSWSMYLYQSEKEINTKLINWIRNQYNLNNELPSETEYTNQKIEIQKDYAMRNFSKYIQENIIEFKDMGFDLSVEWVE